MASPSFVGTGRRPSTPSCEPTIAATRVGASVTPGSASSYPTAASDSATARSCGAPIFRSRSSERQMQAAFGKIATDCRGRWRATQQRLRCRRPVVQLRRPMPGDRKRSDQRCRRSGRREAGLRGGAVLVDDPTQHVATANVAERRGSRGHCADRCGHLESKAAVRPMLVVMPDVVAKDGFEVVATENEHPVEALFSDGPYPPLRMRVRTRRSDGRLDHLYAFGCEHLVKAGGELRVAVSDQEPERPTVLGEIPCEVADNLGDKGAGRMIGDTEDVHHSVFELDGEQHIELAETDACKASQLRTRYGPVSCFTPLRTRSLDHTRGRPYRGPGRLPGPDLPWLAISSCARSTHVIWISSFCHGARADGHTS